MTLVWLPLILFVVLCLILGRNFIRFRGVLKAQLAAYRRGDYQGQLKIIEGFRTNRSEPEHYLFFRGTACYELGRLEEAEQLLRRSLSMANDPARRTVCRDQLGLVLMEQARYDEAAACFRVCIEESPKRGGGHRGMAETLLRQGGENVPALDAARLAVEADRAEKVLGGKLGREAHVLNLSESLAVFAWALTKNSVDPAEVEGALTEAFALCGETTKPIRARLHYCASQAFSALGNTAESTRHIQFAAEIDPLGNYGRLARAAAGTAIPPA
ncbi:MAG TPA: tetratricopeptide repeat protein [Bryobacteraceae bacterium]|nr:tetratricopeptide repeat protein [Bryobacteraceae bacterium]